MGVKVPIGFYRYNKNQPKWKIELGGLMQALYPFMGIASILFIIMGASGQYDIQVSSLVLGILLLILTPIFRIYGRRLAIGKDYKKILKAQKQLKAHNKRNTRIAFASKSKNIAEDHQISEDKYEDDMI